MTDPTQPRTWASTRSRSSAPRTERIASRAWNLWRSAHRNETYAAGDTFLAGYEAGCAAAVAPYVEALRRMTTAAAAERYDVWFNHHASPDLAWPDLFVAGYMEAARLLAAIPAVPEPPAPTEEPMAPTSIPDGDVEMVEAFYEASREHNGQRDDDPDRRPINQIIGEAFARHGLIIIRRDLVPEPPAAQPDAWLEVERLAVVAAARRFLAAHDHVIASAGVTRDDTFAMKNRVDELRDVLRLYDENAARLASSTARARVVAMPPPDPGLISGHIPEGR